MTNHLKIHCLWLSLTLLFSAVVVRAATPFSEYASRIEQAAMVAQEAVQTFDQQSEEAAETESREEEIDRTLYSLREMIPPTEEIDFNGEVVHVDNAWLHQDDKPNDEMTLQRVAARLHSLKERLKTAQQQTLTAPALNDRLKQILAQPEYQTDRQQDSWIQRKLREYLKIILDFLAKLFARQAPTPTSGNGWLMMVFRVALLVGIGLVLVYGTALLLKKIRLRRIEKEEAEPAAREILGEVIDDNLSTEDLMQQAAEMARRGEYRLAIRRAYIALLYELERRGNLQLHRSKTNRDYLNALRNEARIYPSMEQMTQTYERAWYGQRTTSEEDYSGFVERYREAVRQP